MLLRLVHGKWPPEIAPTTADEIAMHEVICDYDAWMADLRGLSASTRERGRAEARFLLRWLSDHGKTVATLSIVDLDAYVAWRGTSMRRTSKALMVSTLRGVLRYLHGSQPQPEHQPVFVNRYGQPLGAAGVRFKLAQYVRTAAKELPSLHKKHVHPHTFRHTAAVQLVAAGVTSR
jgi:site-specific recombinase XerD